MGRSLLDGALPFLAIFGMAFLFFLAGLEIDLDAIGSRPLVLALFAWLILFALACAAALGLRAAEAALLIGGAMLTVILFPVVAMRLTGLSVAKATAHLGQRDGL